MKKVNTNTFRILVADDDDAILDSCRGVFDQNDKTELAGNETILFVDDEKCLADLGKLMLEDYGYTVESVTNPDVALASFKANPGKFDMVITDYMMPEMTGDVLARKILELRPELPIIMCTGFTKSLTPEIVNDTGIKKFITKPIDLELFVKIIRDLF